MTRNRIHVDVDSVALYPTIAPAEAPHIAPSRRTTKIDDVGPLKENRAVPTATLANPSNAPCTAPMDLPLCILVRVNATNAKPNTKPTIEQITVV